VVLWDYCCIKFYFRIGRIFLNDLEGFAKMNRRRI